MSTVPIFAPDGTLGDIPSEQLQSAIQAGGKPGVNVIAPDGSKGVVPADRYVDAVKAGGKVAPFAEQEIQHPGFWASLRDDVAGMIPKVQTPQDVVSLAARTFLPKTGAQVNQEAQQMGAESDARKAVGYSAPYRVMAPVAQSLGVNVPGMEQSAQQGDVGGVMGHASAVPAVMAATEGLARGIPVAGPPVIRGAAKTYNMALNAGAKVAPVAGAVEGVARLIHGDLPGAAYATVGGGYLGKAVRALPEAPPALTNFGRPAPTYPGAPLPANPPPELLQAAPLAEGGASVAISPSDALGNIPVSGDSVPAPQLPAGFQSRAPYQSPVGTADNPTIGQGQLPSLAPSPEVQPQSFPRAMERGPQPISGESALNQLLTSADNATLLRIAKSRGISVSREAQLKAGVANPMLVSKIIDDFGPDELQEIGAKFLEANRFQHQFGNITPEAWHSITLGYYFPDVKIPAAMAKRAQASIAANHPLAQAADDLSGILQQSLDAEKRK